MVKKSLLIVGIAMLIPTLYATTGYPAAPSYVADDDFIRYVREADLIIEGEVSNIESEVAKTSPQYVGQGRQQIMLDFGTVVAIDFYVDQAFKGRPQEGRALRIYAKPNFKGSFNTLLPNRKYLLFLKKHRFKKGYEVMNQGRMEWTIFEYEGARKVKNWSQLPQYRPIDEYRDYEDLVNQIQSQLSVVPIR